MSTDPTEFDWRAVAGGDGPAGALGVRFEEVTPELVRASFPVADVVRQPAGIVHGGVYALVAESMCSLGTVSGVWRDGMVGLGMSNNATFLRSVADGTVHAVARRVHGGRTTWIWDVEMTDDRGRVCALVRMTIAIRPRR
ncbi:MAG TPA: PaaI family thioesterase [Solirubrobacterales bacterium]|jgi:uncharacterized protein (TIGR00369 family)